MSSRKVRHKFISAALAAALVALCFAVTGCNTKNTPDIAPHLISEPETSPVRPIDSRETIAMSDFSGEFTDERLFVRLEELFTIVVHEGGKPEFCRDDPVQPVYAAAIDILDSIILNRWHGSADGEMNIVHSIHDFLVSRIDYDFELYERFQANMGGDEFKYDPAFDISGVFLNKRAVCDGISRAFVFLCAVEGVEALRVTGTYGGVPHAWNKVKLGSDWYNVDVTADMVNYNIDGGEYYKQIAHGYFLVSDATMTGFKPTAHVFAHEMYPAMHDYDYFSDKRALIGGDAYDITVKDQAELNGIFSAINKNKRKVGKIELKLDFAGKTEVNGADMYRAEIAEAYKKLKFADFDMSQSNPPYFRYPNGVYVFLMYK